VNAYSAGWFGPAGAIFSIKPCPISNDGYSTFMLAALTIGHHLSISAF
jgi:hypothetical protein